jgi:hypothetical protein
VRSRTCGNACCAHASSIHKSPPNTKSLERVLRDLVIPPRPAAAMTRSTRLHSASDYRPRADNTAMIHSQRLDRPCRLPSSPVVPHDANARGLLRPNCCLRRGVHRPATQRRAGVAPERCPDRRAIGASSQMFCAFEQIFGANQQVPHRGPSYKESRIHGSPLSGSRRATSTTGD